MCYGNCQYEKYDGECGNNRMQGKPGAGCYEKEMQECKDCAGTGKVWVSCCGDLFQSKPDTDVCPTCKEHSVEEDICETCSGNGEVEV